MGTGVASVYMIVKGYRTDLVYDEQSGTWKADEIPAVLTGLFVATVYVTDVAGNVSFQTEMDLRLNKGKIINEMGRVSLRKPNMRRGGLLNVR